MIKVKAAPTYVPEREYILRVMLGEFLGLEYAVEYEDRQVWSITSDNGKKLILPDILFQFPRNKWFTTKSLPKRPLSIWDTREAKIDCPLVDYRVPVIYGSIDSDPFYCAQFRNNLNLYIPIDIFGSAFFMLSRYEELVKVERDEHCRFPATASLAFQEGFLERPIVNEYLEILWFFLCQLNVNERRKDRRFRIIPTHDVDVPFEYLFCSPWQMVRRLGGDFIKRKDPVLALQNVVDYIRVKTMGNRDPFDSFDLIMDISEKEGLRSTFYFKAGGNSRHDNAYSLLHPKIQQLMRKVHTRGHLIGFHPSYEACLDKGEWCREFYTLKKAVGDIPVLDGRTHFLRFQIPLTWRFGEEVRLSYDSSLAFADQGGFRCGCCFEYPVFDLEERTMLNLRERPLIIMECAAIDERFMALGMTEKALAYMKMLKERCRSFEGDFVFLWHNTRLLSDSEISMFQEMIKG